MRKEKLLLISILIIITIYSFSNENKYYNNQIGISFIIPDNLEIIEDINSDINWKYCVTISFFSFNNPEINNVTRYNKEQYLKNLHDENKEFIAPKNDIYNNGSEKYFRYKNKTIGFYRFLLGSTMIINYYNKQLIIIKNDYIIEINIFYNDKKLKILKEYRNFFNYFDDLGYGNWKNPISKKCMQFYNLIKTKSKKAPKELIKVEEYFDKLISSLELFNPNSSYYTPTVPNLRFRESPDLNGKFIRSLNQGEKLELIEKGKEETINGTKGTWVKVKTEKGEVGWCFDAYLEPYDDVKKK